jgi:hypothetical protein
LSSVYEIYVYNYSNIDTDDLNMKLIIPGSVKNIESYALWGLEGVTEIVFEDGVESIGDYAVYNCKYLKKITIPESVTYIDDVGVGYLDSNEENVISKDLVMSIPYLPAFGRFAPYLERDCILPATPCASSVPRTM